MDIVLVRFFFSPLACALRPRRGGEKEKKKSFLSFLSLSLSHRSCKTMAKSQRIVATRLLCRVQYHVCELSRLQRIYLIAL